ncbi:MAG: hypothetical protein K0S67_2454 [Nitrososphaeraceae archaeon]|nr:hypothetical protein [Nitrososphaeraceae archaeon]
MPSSDKANRRRKEEGEGKEEKSFRPKLSDFKRKTGEDIWMIFLKILEATLKVY